MIYNYQRYGNIAEFGAKYQLTSINATDLSDRIKDIPRGLYQYFIEPPHLKDDFPYIIINTNKDGFSDNYFNGGMISGILWLNLCIVICVTPISIYKIKDKILKYFILSLKLTGIVMTIIIIINGGSTQRYVVDFFWMFSTISMIEWFMLYKNSTKEKNKNIIEIIVYILLILSLILNLYATFLTSEFDICRTRWNSVFEIVEYIF